MSRITTFLLSSVAKLRQSLRKVSVMNSVGAFVARDAELYTERRELCGMCASYAALDLRGLLSPVAGCNDFVLFLVIVRRDLFLPIMLPRGETRLAHIPQCARIFRTHYTTNRGSSSALFDPLNCPFSSLRPPRPCHTSSRVEMAAAPHFDMQIKLLMIGDSGAHAI